MLGIKYYKIPNSQHYEWTPCFLDLCAVSSTVEFQVNLKHLNVVEIYVCKIELFFFYLLIVTDCVFFVSTVTHCHMF